MERTEMLSDFYGKTDGDFEAFADYRLHICEKRELLGNSSRLIYICKKRG